MLSASATLQEFKQKLSRLFMPKLGCKNVAKAIKSWYSVGCLIIVPRILDLATISFEDLELEVRAPYLYIGGN